MVDPERVLVAGDWHGNRRWAVDVIWQARKLLDDEPVKVIVQLGDFGFWPWREKEWADGDARPEALRYLQDVNAALILADAYLFVTPGNHDDYDAIERWQELHKYQSDYVDLFYPIGEGVPLRRILILPRGHRWEWHGRKWLSVGGAVSVDRISSRRVQHESWWPQEEITDEQERAILESGHADVMIAHDYPTGVALTFHAVDHHQFNGFHPIDLQRSRDHQARVQRIVNVVEPRHYLHGHLHIRHGRLYNFGYGPVQVDGMGMDGEDGNFAVLNAKTMEWE